MVRVQLITGLIPVVVVVELVDEAVMAVHQAQEGAVAVPLILELVVHQAQAVEVK